MTDPLNLEELVERAQLVLEKTRRKKRKLYRVGQKSRRRSGETFVKTADGWRRVAKNPRKKPSLFGSLISKAKELLGPKEPQPPKPKPPPSTDIADLFGRPKKRKKTRSARPKPRRGGSAGSPKRWPEPEEG